MNDFEKQLQSFPPLLPPDHVWDRLQGRSVSFRQKLFKGGLMATAAAGLLAWLTVVLTWTPAAPIPAGPALQEADAWLEREAAQADVAPDERVLIQGLLQELASGTPSRRDAAEKLLEARLDTAIPFLREAARSDNAEYRASAQGLVRRWEEQRARIPLAQLLARARKEAKAGDDWKATAQRAVNGDVAALTDLRKIGWPAAPAVSDAAAAAGAAEQIRARALLQDLLLPLLHPGHPLVTLHSRKRNEQNYGDSAYSFRYATRDAESVKNVVDVVYNSCGLLHLTPYGGTESYAVDAGKTTLDQVTELPKQGWRRANCILAAEGHVYVVEIRADGASYTYKFEVKKATSLSIDFVWAGIGEPRKAPAISPQQGKNGAFGTCGGAHPEY